MDYITCLIVGGDRTCKKVPKLLSEIYGITKIKHWTGRENLRGEPRNIALMVIVTGFAGHAVVQKAKNIARKSGAHIIYLNRGLSKLAEAV